MQIKTNLENLHTAEKAVQKIYPAVTVNYNGKVGNFYKVTLSAKPGAPGSRNSVSGREMPKASWEAHRDFLAAIFAADENAHVKSALAIYKGSEDFADKFSATAYQSIGSKFHPVELWKTSNH